MTYSIVARDQETGALGAAVQSHWFSVGPQVPWAEPGVGAVATQANIEVSYGPRALDLLRAGRSAPEALAELIAADEYAGGRQVAVVDTAGRVAVETGSGCMPYAGHTAGDGFSCQANLMATPGVWPAMAAAFTSTRATFVHRLLAALDAAEAAGGDVRGRQSAAIVVVAARGERWQPAGRPPRGGPSRAACRAAPRHPAAGRVRARGRGRPPDRRGRPCRAADRYVAAHALAPDSTELAFWAGLSLVARREPERGMTLVRRAVAAHAGWAELLGRLELGTAPGVEETRRLFGASG